MSSTNISIKQEAYDFLCAIRKEGESFSDAILSLREGGTLREFHGILSDIDTKGLKKKLDDVRRKSNEQSHDRIRHLHDN